MNKKTKKLTFNIVVIVLLITGLAWVCTRFALLASSI